MPSRHAIEDHDIGAGGDKAVLMRMKGEDQRSLLDLRRSGSLDPSHARVAVTKREREGSTESIETLIQQQPRVDLAPKREQFATAADPRALGPDENLPFGRLAKLDLDQLHAARSAELHRPDLVTRCRHVTP